MPMTFSRSTYCKAAKRRRTRGALATDKVVLAMLPRLPLSPALNTQICIGSIEISNILLLLFKPICHCWLRPLAKAKVK